MTVRRIVLAVALAFIALLTFLTASVIVREGLDVLGAISILVLIMFAFGIVGALVNPPD